MNIQTFSRVTFSPLEFSIATGLSLSTVHRRLAAGAIAFTRSGRRVLIPRSELERLSQPLKLPLLAQPRPAPPPVAGLMGPSPQIGGLLGN